MNYCAKCGKGFVQKQQIVQLTYMAIEGDDVTEPDWGPCLCMPCLEDIMKAAGVPL